MQNPAQEVEGVVKALVEAPNATAQMVALRTYFTHDASFDHPLCAVPSGKEVYQWLRLMSNSTIDVHTKAFDASQNKLFLEAVQTLRPTILPFIGIPARIMVLLTLRKGTDNLYYVERQEDFYAIQVLPGKLIFFPFGEYAIVALKYLAGFACYLLSLWFGVILGLWKPAPLRPARAGSRKL